MKRIAEYKGRTVEIINDFHYSSDRCWVKGVNGTFDGIYDAGSVYKCELQNIRKVSETAGAGLQKESGECPTGL